MGLYSAGNIADTYSKQTEGIQTQLQGSSSLDIADQPVGSRMTSTYQSLDESKMGQSPFGTSFGSPPQASNPGFRSVSAPVAKPPSDKPQQQLMKCGGCDMLATGVIVKANGVPYHVACFKCTSCSMNLKQKGFFVVEGKLYCETHAKRHAQAPGPDMVAVPVYR
ncbi:PDZ and LIM domain protein 3-like [Physella acuta]|uniref:PDZ and LIM domain protein 3-like n=1 Tax=Physella acuta TaxID=109671 RepID=UPI0027DD77CC|nr:PDZ and LIM domain protein 3-like [Physella acuta]